MMMLLCPECCQCREPVEGRCPVCCGTLDLAIPDLSLESLADGIGDLQERLGKADVFRKVLPRQGELWATSKGLVFVPNESRVIVFAEVPHKSNNRSFLIQLWSRLRRSSPARRFTCERRRGELFAPDRIAMAELIRNDPGILFWSRGAIAEWRRRKGQWEFVRSNAQVWPEQILMRDRDGDRALQTWLEATECPLPVNVR